MLLLAAAIVALTVIAHSYLGEKYILMRLFRRTLPELFGSDEFTKQTLRFAWHVTSIFGLGFSVALALIHFQVATPRNLLFCLSAVFAVSALFPLIGTRGRHLSWIAFVATAVIAGIHAIDA